MNPFTRFLFLCGWGEISPKKFHIILVLFVQHNEGNTSSRTSTRMRWLLFGHVILCSWLDVSELLRDCQGRDKAAETHSSQTHLIRCSLNFTIEKPLVTFRNSAHELVVQHASFHGLRGPASNFSSGGFGWTAGGSRDTHLSHSGVFAFCLTEPIQDLIRKRSRERRKRGRVDLQNQTWTAPL